MTLSQWLDQERGRAKSIAKRFSLTESAVTQWRTNGVPATRMMDILRITGGDVTLAEMLEQHHYRKGA